MKYEENDIMVIQWSRRFDKVVMLSCVVGWVGLGVGLRTTLL